MVGTPAAPAAAVWAGIVGNAHSWSDEVVSPSEEDTSEDADGDGGTEDGIAVADDE
jgi:hypothetical protein